MFKRNYVNVNCYQNYVFINFIIIKSTENFSRWATGKEVGWNWDCSWNWVFNKRNK